MSLPEPRIEYLRDRENIDHYLKTVSEILRYCIEAALSVEDELFYKYMGTYLKLTPPSIFPELHQVVANSLKKTYEILKRIDMFSTTGNAIKLDECSVELESVLTNLTGGFFAWIKYLYDCKDGDTSYIQIIKSDYPEMYEGLIFEDM